MKTLFISVVIGLISLMLSGQNVTQLEEAILSYSPFQKMIQEGDSYVYVVKESVNQKFAQDPIGFMKENFDIQKFISQVANEKYDAYEVTFQSSNGRLIADFDNVGNLLQTRENFKDVILPQDIRNDIYQNYTGWTIIDSRYNAKTKGDIVASATYKVRLQKGKAKEILKIDAAERGVSVVVR